MLGMQGAIEKSMSASRSKSVDVMVPLRAPFVDARGEIRNLIDAAFTSAAVITSVKGAIRGNHYHSTDYHYCWLQSGSMIYLHRRAGEARPPQRWIIEPGQMFYTPPKYEHAMHFTKDSVLFVFARNNREMAHYEADTVRVSPLVWSSTPARSARLARSRG
jgi:oxalate decarboxylase/phosphoglucose isomerase-like protein (cupin superfamily)